MQGYPTIDNCDPTNPREVFQWAFVALPFKGETPLMVQDDAREEWSELFWNLGFRHHPELAVKRVEPPVRGGLSTLNPAVAVLDIDQPGPQPSRIPDPALMTPTERAAVIARLAEIGALHIPAPPIEGARVEYLDG